MDCCAVRGTALFCRDGFALFLPIFFRRFITERHLLCQNRIVVAGFVRAYLRPQELCLHNAAAKAEAVFREHPDSTVIGADTLVFLEGFPLGKPEDEEEARSMLRKLSGRTHHVCTAVAIRSPLGMKNLAVLTEVTFPKLTEKDIRHYMELVDVMDKAGSYAFQEHGEMIISSVRGDTDNVIGLPVRDVMKCLNGLGYRA